jgi:galactokinase
MKNMDKLSTISRRFRDIFKETPLLLRSPGRVNLIGEHTDYNEGFVLPAAIDKEIYFALSPRFDRRCEIHAYDLKDSFQFSIDDLSKSDKGWPNYLMGVVDQLNKKGLTLSGFNCVFGGNIPIAAGLSSSAALEAGLASALNEIFQLKLDKLTIVKLSQKAENEFVGVNCGIMDQLANVFSKEKHVFKLDCRSLELEYFPFERDDIQVVLCDTQIKRELASSEYNIRRLQCEEGVRAIGKSYPYIKSLRDITESMLQEHKSSLDNIVYRRCKYVIEENERVLAACNNLMKGDFDSFGKLMYQSHAGLRDEYEVSCAELDILVNGASAISGVFGSRMMGAGFGGCTINLVFNDKMDDFEEKITKVFRDRLRTDPVLYITKITEGTAILN